MVAREGVETAQGYAPVSHGYRDVTRVGTRVSTWSRCRFRAWPGPAGKHISIRSKAT